MKLKGSSHFQSFQLLRFLFLTLPLISFFFYSLPFHAISQTSSSPQKGEREKKEKEVLSSSKNLVSLGRIQIKIPPGWRAEKSYAYCILRKNNYEININILRAKPGGISYYKKDFIKRFNKRKNTIKSLIANSNQYSKKKIRVNIDKTDHFQFKKITMKNAQSFSFDWNYLDMTISELTPVVKDLKMITESNRTVLVGPYAYAFYIRHPKNREKTLRSAFKKITDSIQILPPPPKKDKKPSRKSLRII